MKDRRTCFGRKSKELLFLVLLLVLVPCDGKSREKKIEYKNRIPIGFWSIGLQNQTCLQVHASMSAGDFFEGLERTDTPAGPEFRKRGQRVNSFPSELVVDIWVQTLSCRAKPPLVPFSGSTSDLLKSLRFETAWKSGEELRHIEDVVVERNRLPWRELADEWTFRLTIPAQNVPLASQLIVLLNSREGREIKTFSAHL